MTKNRRGRRFWDGEFGVYDVVFVDFDGGVDTWTFAQQPTTEDIFWQKTAQEHFAIQKVNGEFLVYDIKGRNRAPRKWGVMSLPLPSFKHEDADVAIAWAVLNAGRS